MILSWRPILFNFLLLYIQGHSTINAFENTKQSKWQPKDNREELHHLNKAEWLNVRKLASCEDDLARLCPKSMQDNLKLLICLKGDPKKPNELQTDCQHDLWKMQMELSKKGFFSKNGFKVCKQELYSMTPCTNEDSVRELGGSLFCLLSYSHHTMGRNSSAACRGFLRYVSRIIFIDFSTIKPFLGKCEGAIEEYRCGRVVYNQSADSSSQGDVLDCLHEHRRDLKRDCLLQMERLVELRGSDYHLDMNLYFACRQSREELCADVQSGNGKVLECLMKRKFDSRMSLNCKRELLRRQKLRSENYKSDRSLAPCKESIDRYHCDSENQASQNHLEGAKLSNILLCLESKHKLEEDALDKSCLTAMALVRRQIMEDYKISPNIVVQCAKDLEQHCVLDSIQRQGKALHCLMKLYSKKGSSNGALESGCKAALNEIIAVVDPSSNIAVDPVITGACNDVIQSNYCRQFNKTLVTIKGSSKEGQVYSCLNYLLTHAPYVGDVRMSQVCKTKLIQLQFILVRNWAFNNNLYRACHMDAINLCNAPKEWYNPQSGSNAPQQSHITFHCLYQKMRDADMSLTALAANKNVTESCRHEIKNTLQIQASRIDLNPVLYEACLGDVSSLCHGVAMQKAYECLQKNMKSLQPPCREQMVEFAQAQSRDFSLDKLLMEACMPMANRYCQHVIQAGRIGTSDMMECLIKVKKDANMEPRCRAAIEHHQILSLQDYHISFSFTKHCAQDIAYGCQDIKEKNKVVSCLSERVLLEYLGRQDEVNKVKVSQLCRKQLQFELFQRSDSFSIDVNLQSVCSEDVERFCLAEKNKGEGVNVCLQTHEEELSEACRKKLTKRATLLVADTSVDAQLFHQCNKMIIRHCSDINVDHRPQIGPNNEILKCLQNAAITDKNFHLQCSRILLKRMEVLRKDYRLDPGLKSNCQNDINHYCSSEAAAIQSGANKQGRVVQCLKDQYLNSKPKKMLLQERCQTYIRQLIRESNLNYHLDPMLKSVCNNDVKRLCGRELERTDAMDGDGSVVNCLKKAFVRKMLSTPSCQQQIIRTLKEGRADVHVDPSLYAACLPELQNPGLCGEVIIGGGQHFSCLLKLRKTHSSTGRMSKACRLELDLRMEMWQLGSKVVPELDSVMDLAEGIQKSTSRLYILAVLAAIVAVIFCFGICFGRCTKRKYERIAMKVR